MEIKLPLSVVLFVVIVYPCIKFLLDDDFFHDTINSEECEFSWLDLVYTILFLTYPPWRDKRCYLSGKGSLHDRVETYVDIDESGALSVDVIQFKLKNFVQEKLLSWQMVCIVVTYAFLHFIFPQTVTIVKFWEKSYNKEGTNETGSDSSPTSNLASNKISPASSYAAEQLKKDCLSTGVSEDSCPKANEGLLCYDINDVDKIPDELLESLFCVQKPCKHNHDHFRLVGNKLYINSGNTAYANENKKNRQTRKTKPSTHCSRNESPHRGEVQPRYINFEKADRYPMPDRENQACTEHTTALASNGECLFQRLGSCPTGDYTVGLNILSDRSLDDYSMLCEMSGRDITERIRCDFGDESQCLDKTQQTLQRHILPSELIHSVGIGTFVDTQTHSPEKQEGKATSHISDSEISFTTPGNKTLLEYLGLATPTKSSKSIQTCVDFRENFHHDKFKTNIQDKDVLLKNVNPYGVDIVHMNVGPPRANSSFVDTSKCESNDMFLADLSTEADESVKESVPSPIKGHSKYESDFLASSLKQPHHDYMPEELQEVSISDDYLDTDIKYKDYLNNSVKCLPAELLNLSEYSMSLGMYGASLLEVTASYIVTRAIIKALEAYHKLPSANAGSSRWYNVSLNNSNGDYLFDESSSSLEDYKDESYS